jgi:hypothetical protein
LTKTTAKRVLRRATSDTLPMVYMNYISIDHVITQWVGSKDQLFSAGKDGVNALPRGSVSPTFWEVLNPVFMFKLFRVKLTPQTHTTAVKQHRTNAQTIAYLGHCNTMAEFWKTRLTVENFERHEAAILAAVQYFDDWEQECRKQVDGLSLEHNFIPVDLWRRQRLTIMYALARAYYYVDKHPAVFARHGFTVSVFGTNIVENRIGQSRAKGGLDDNPTLDKVVQTDIRVGDRCGVPRRLQVPAVVSR